MSTIDFSTFLTFESILDVFSGMIEFLPSSIMDLISKTLGGAIVVLA